MKATTPERENSADYSGEEIESVVGALEETDQWYLRSHRLNVDGLSRDEKKETLDYLLEAEVVEVLSEDPEGTPLYDSESVDRKSLENLTDRELT
jgi:hypothetical protein